MTNLTPEAVKAALEGATPGPWVVDMPGYHPGMIMVLGPGLLCQGFKIATDVSLDEAIRKGHDANLIAMAPDLARECLRLKKVEEAGKALADAARSCLPATQDPLSQDQAMRLGFSLSAFRAAVEGE
jgi:hypothetical protein